MNKEHSKAGMGEAGTSKTAEQKKQERLERLRNLSRKRDEARKLNHQEVVEEDRRNKLPPNWEAKKRRLEWEEEEDRKRYECKANGENYEKVRILETQADDAERWEKRKKAKTNPDQGFSGYAAATYRQYQRNTKQLKPNPEEYAQEKLKMGASFYPDVNTLGVSEHKDSKEAIDRMVDDLEKQISKRKKYSRRRAFDPDSEVDYINERNKKFNEKLERYYGRHTAEIKQNLERGTAL